MAKKEFKLRDDEIDDAEERRERELQDHARRLERLKKRRDAEDYLAQASRPERAR